MSETVHECSYACSCRTALREVQYNEPPEYQPDEEPSDDFAAYADWREEIYDPDERDYSWGIERDYFDVGDRL